ncbi:MAG: MerR family DNA-binding transcriptional regulator [Deltaproteobacteria bacterium]|nr:MerR family DNA-binding transcriptional regulator [Deltaproteobacteria bacterium]
MRIGQLSKCSGLSRDTIRFYEKIGLLPQAVRSENGYRDYPEALAGQLKLLNHAKELGFDLKEIRAIAKLFLSKSLSVKQMNGFLREKNKEIDEKITRLKSFKKEIAAALDGKCRLKDEVFK